MVTSAARQPRNPFRMTPQMVDKNDPFAHAHPVVKFCYIGAVTILFLAVATLAFTTLVINPTAESVTDPSMVSHYSVAEQHLRTRVAMSTTTTSVNKKAEQQRNHPRSPSSTIASPTVPLTPQQQQQRREGGGVQGQARVVVSGENNSNGKKDAHMKSPSTSLSPDSEDDEENTPEDEEEDLILDNQELIILQHSNPLGVNKKILGAAKEQVQKEIREAHRSDYLDFGHADQGSASSNAISRHEQHDMMDTDQQRQTHYYDTADLENANDNTADRQHRSRDQESSSSQHSVVKLIRRRGDTPVTVSADNADRGVKTVSDKEADNMADNESAHHYKRSDPIRISAADQLENEERPVVFTRNKRASSNIVGTADAVAA